jgi:hypothetical protein
VGLYTAFIPMVIYALLGSSRVLSVSSTTTLAILAGTQLGLAVPDGDPVKLVTATATLTALVGAMLLLARLLRLGFVANFISSPVLTGFKAGIGLVIVLDQVPKLLGIHITKQGFFVDLLHMLDPDGSDPSPASHLFKRRPDLPNLALTCDNTNIALLLDGKWATLGPYMKSPGVYRCAASHVTCLEGSVRYPLCRNVSMSVAMPSRPKASYRSTGSRFWTSRGRSRSRCARRTARYARQRGGSRSGRRIISWGRPILSPTGRPSACSSTCGRCPPE